jgi:hypothetical protein
MLMKLTPVHLKELKPLELPTNKLKLLKMYSDVEIQVFFLFLHVRHAHKLFFKLKLCSWTFFISIFHLHIFNLVKIILKLNIIWTFLKKCPF